ncbi:flagellar basal-body rod protein FlgF, putative [Roseobacter sp. AzwK-3b]|uniref:flagellar hook-basal body complex protein n=1 Tax=Roseobacter sp. AzwK-3b TaxID=351016 RepID=UPI000156992B|nr:flagellar hook-basal body complex protein [Roseobacter sp. AzwK-3b]EDM73065.1 flagellar basal-body rod protein FlgF, putative [Roseobacter sp. AzwK-3b]
MENTGYTTLTRQSGLLREIQVIANNIANAATTGYREESLIFAEYVKRVENGPSISMATPSARSISSLQGGLQPTGGTLDFAIEGDGFFLIEAADGNRLTRAGSFSLSAAGELATHDGHRVLDAGGAPVFLPPNATDLRVAADGTISAEGRLIGQIGLVRPLDPNDLIREGGTLFRTDVGTKPVEGSRILQGFLEGSNVDPIAQVARMVEVQRAYEMGQSFLENENTRIRETLKTMIR